MRKQKSRSKMGKKQKNLYLSDHARQLLAVFARNLGVSDTAVVELLIREKAARDNVEIPASAGESPSEVPFEGQSDSI